MSENKVIEILKKEGMMKPGEIAEKTGLSKDEVSKIINKLKKEGKVTSPKRCYYAVG